MGAIEGLQRDCGYCRQPITLKWKDGPMPSEGMCLVVDQVFHDRCWAKFWAIASAPARRGWPAALTPSTVVAEVRTA